MKLPATAVIITFNEEKNIARCIEGLLNLVDEVLVLDSYSEDNTQAICSRYPVSFYQQKWKGYSASKNYANSLAKNDWILSIDADEVPDEKLSAELLKIKIDKIHEVFKLNRLTNYCGKWIYHSGWYPDKKIRLFNRLNTLWEGEFVHETLSFTVSPTINILEGHLLHYSYTNYKQHRERADKYSMLTAQKLHDKGKKASFFKPYVSAFGRFVSMFFIKKGFLDGKMGFKIALISATSNVVKYKELRKLCLKK